MRLMGRLAVPALVLMAWVCGSGLAAQDTGEAEPQPDSQASEQPEGRKDWLNLYVSVARGASSAEAVNPSIETSVTRNSENRFTMEDAVYSRAAFGWKLGKDKGEFRLVFNGYKEDGYTFTAVGRAAEIGAPGPPNGILNNLDWWTIEVVDGNLTAALSPPMWTAANDANSDGAAERSEVTYGTPTLEFSRTITDDLQNRVQTFDFVYGRDFGKRRFTGHWWGGLRYSVYDGNVPAAAWLKPDGLGEGFTDGAFLKFINLHQEFTGGGPTGAVEFDFNFFNDRLALFLGSQFAFMFGSVDLDSGDFGTLITSDPGQQTQVTLTVPARLTEHRQKSLWQTAAEAGVRIKLKRGLEFEAAYNISGHLDVVLLATEILIPQGETGAGSGTSALYNTQDLVYDGWRAGVAFQF